MPRLFIALRPPLMVRQALAETMEGVPGARWQDDEQLHLTLRFVGDIDRRDAEELAIALARIRAPAPIVSIAGVGRFARRGRTDTLWAALAPHDGLAALHRKVDRACVDVGLDPDHRAYHPHITLARLSRGLGVEVAIEAWLARCASLTSDPFALPHLTLYESLLGQGGATYHAVACWPLTSPVHADGGTSADAPGSDE